MKALFIFLLAAQSFTYAQTGTWYKVYSGKINNTDAVVHLNFNGDSYRGYTYFSNSQWPMALQGVKENEITLSVSNGPVSMVLVGNIEGETFSGTCELAKEGATPRKGTFSLNEDHSKAYTPFALYAGKGQGALAAKMKNQSECIFSRCIIWPTKKDAFSTSVKKMIHTSFEEKTAITDPAKWIATSRTNFINNWKKDYEKMDPAETAQMGMSLSLVQEDVVNVMYENDRLITLAHYTHLYSGGAHGLYKTELATFDKTSGKQLRLSDVVNPAGIKLLPAMLNQVARVLYNIKNTKPLDQNGFTVKEIKPSTNFYVTNGGIGFLYKPYEIKSFADGEINLFVPLPALKAYLQPAFKMYP